MNSLPVLYVLNAASVAKFHATQHLAVDLMGYNIKVAIITETHYNNKTCKNKFYYSEVHR
mgnify:CR=1 FL=1